MQDSDGTSGKNIRHPSAPDIDLYATKVSRNQAIWFSEQLQERLKAQAQAYMSVQSRAVTFSGILSAVSVAIVGGIIALYLDGLETPARLPHLVPMISAGVVLAGMFITANAFAIWVSSPVTFHIVGYFPQHPQKMLHWLDYNSEKEEVSILYDALNYEGVMKENEKNIAVKAGLLLKAQKVSIMAFPVGVLALIAASGIQWAFRAYLS
jgi:hypothetical protein